MVIIKLQDVDMDKLVKELKLGKVIVYPTETCYGLGCDATNKKATDRLFKIKKRPKDKAVLVLASGLDMVRKYIKLSPKILDLAQRYWPGPLTIVAPVIDIKNLSNKVINHDNTIAIRVTDHHFANELCKKLGTPIVSTSANIATLENPYDIDIILNMYSDVKQKPDIIIDNGVLPHKNPSTIIKVDNGEIKVLRQGDIVVEVQN